MKLGWQWGSALVICLALGLAACGQAFTYPPATEVQTLSVPPSPAEASVTPVPTATALPAAPTPSPSLRPLTQTSQPGGAFSPSPTSIPPIDIALVAQYDPWSLGHTLAWSPDGKTLAVSAGEWVYFYTGDPLRETGRIDVETWGVGLAFSPHEQNLLALAGRDGAVQIWDVARLERLAYQPAHPKGANSVAFSPDGLLLASTGNDALVRLWETSDFLSGQPVEPVAVMIGGAVTVPAIRFSPDGSLVASIDLQAIRLRDPATQRLVRTLRSETSMFTITFSPDGQWLAAGELGSQVRIWDLASGDEKALLRAGVGSADPARAFVWSLDFSPDGKLLAAGSSVGTITLWTLADGEVRRVFPAHTRAVSGLAFDPQGSRLVSCGLDAALRWWPIP